MDAPPHKVPHVAESLLVRYHLETLGSMTLPDVRLGAPGP
jgi:hypothetical protein